MASLPIGSDTLLKIRTATVDIVIKSKGKQTLSIIHNDTRSSSLKVVAADVERISVPIQGMTEEYHDHAGYAVHDISVEPLFFEQTDYVVTIKARNNERLAFQSNSPLIEERIGRVLDDDASLLSGVVNFGNNVGFSDFAVVADGKAVLSVRIEVYPTKITYKEDYQDMMTDINNMVSESILDFMKKTYQVFVPNHKRNEVPAVFFTILQTIYYKYIRAVNRIISVPHHKLISEHEVVPYYKAKRTDSHSEKWLRKHPEYLKRTGNHILADKVLSVRKQITYDTQENRLVKFMLRSTVLRINDFGKRYLNSTQHPDRSILNGAKKMERELRRILSSSFLAEVSEYNAAHSMSLVFGMAPGYRELYKYYLMLQNGISVGGDIFRMSVRETALLYEYWCFIKLYSILKERYELKSPDIIKADRKGVTVDLVKGRPSRITFLNTQTGERFYLAYNPSESVTQTVNQRPDNVLELEKKGSTTAYKYVFDAKYRIENRPEGSFYPDTKPGPKVDDINTMHRYRDSIVYENPDSRFTFEKTMFGAYILFPYGNEEEYRNHRFYKSIESVNIGGLPFLPSATTLVTQLLDALITDSSESAFERATLPAGIENRIRTVNWNKRDVLIGLVQDKAHMDLFLNSRRYWTRRFDRNNLPIRYVALYEKGSGIRYFGETVSWKQEERSNLPGNSKHDKDMYHVFEVLEWTELTDTVKVEETGPNPIAYTNYFLLSTSKTYSELRLRNEADYRFFTELKRRTDTKILERDDNTTAFESGDTRVLINDDQIHIIRDGIIAGSCTVSEFVKRPNTTFRILQSYME